MKLVLLALLTITLVVIDWFVVHAGMATGWYILGGWLLVWLIIRIWVLKSFISSVAAVIGVSLCEDFLYLCASTVFEGRPFYPLYCHGWLPTTINEVVTSLTKFLGYDWLGLPSLYYVSIAAVIALVVIHNERRRHNEGIR